MVGGVAWWVGTRGGRDTSWVGLRGGRGCVVGGAAWWAGLRGGRVQSQLCADRAGGVQQAPFLSTHPAASSRQSSPGESARVDNVVAQVSCRGALTPTRADRAARQRARARPGPPLSQTSGEPAPGGVCSLTSA